MTASLSVRRTPPVSSPAEGFVSIAPLTPTSNRRNCDARKGYEDHTGPGSNLSDADLITKLRRLVANEREATTEVLRSLMEFDARRLYLGDGYPSLFAYCTQVLHYAEHAALNRIEVARAARRLPALLEHIADGRLHLTGARLLAPHLTDENADALLSAAHHKSKREIEELIAALKPRPDAAPMVRQLSTSTVSFAEPPASTFAASPSPPPAVPGATAAMARSTVIPLATERFKVQFTISRETRDKLQQVQDLIRHVVPNGDPATIFDRALTVLLAELERKKFAATTTPRRAREGDETSRHIPASVRREVWHRDGGQCAFVGSHGRCSERGFLEFHHLVPFAVGGAATVESIELRCRAHNAHEASLFLAAEDTSFLETVTGEVSGELRRR